MYKITKINGSRLAVKPLAAPAPTDVVQGGIVLPAKSEIEGGFLAEVLVVGSEVNDRNKSDGPIDVKVGDTVFIGRKVEQFPAVGGIVIVDGYEVEAVLEVEGSPKPDVVPDGKIDSQVTIS